MYIFDLDGTLTDSNGLWIGVDEEFLGRRGLTLTREYADAVAKSIFPVAAAYTKEYYRLPDAPEDIEAEWVELAREWYAHRVPLKPGALAFLDRCRAEGRPMALFTACQPELCALVLDRFGLAPYFTHIVYAQELGFEKHDPRCFLQLCQRLGTAPEGCTLFDDSPFNCATARSVGMEVVGVYDDFFQSREGELTAAAHRCIRSFEALL